MSNLKTIAEEDGYGTDFLVPPDTIDTGSRGEVTISDYQYAASPDGTYTVCALEDQPGVLLFKEQQFVHKQDIVDPYLATPAVANNGTIIVAGYTDGGHQDGDHLLKSWNEDGTEIFATELRSQTNQVAITPDGKFAAIHTAEVLNKYRSGSRPEDAYDFSTYFIDLEQGQILSRYTEQIPGIKTGGGARNMQIWDFAFVTDDSTPLLALYETRDGSAQLKTTDDTSQDWLFDAPESSTDSDPKDGNPDVQESISRDAVSSETPLIDLRGTIVQYGRPDINNHPDHYYLTADAKEKLDE